MESRACPIGRIENRLAELGLAPPPLGSTVSLEEASLAARDTMLQFLAITKQVIGDLDRIASMEFVRGFVRFADQPKVIDGTSGLLIALWGEPGRHARTATGAAQLSFGAAVQFDIMLRLQN